MKRTVALILTFICVLSIFNFVVGEEKAIELVFNKAEETLFVNKTTNLKAKLQNTKEKVKYEYKSSDESIATISAKGQIKGVAPGVVKITCFASTEQAKYEKSYNLTVINPIKNIKLGKKINMAVGTSYPLVAEITPEDATNKNVEWSSSKEGIATVNDKGVVYAHKKGSVTITAMATDGSKKKATISISVKDYDRVIRSKEGALVTYTTGSGMFGIGYKSKNDIVDYSSDVDRFSLDREDISLADSVIQLIPLKTGEDTFTIQVVNYLTRRVKNFKYNVYVTPDALKYANDEEAEKADKEYLN